MDISSKNQAGPGTHPEQKKNATQRCVAQQGGDQPVLVVEEPDKQQTSTDSDLASLMPETPEQPARGARPANSP
jgi:hypothetical protein